jgi:hypothetical protein
MELTFEECETAASEDELLAALAAAKTNVAPFERKRPARKPLPEHLPRERIVIAAPEASGPMSGMIDLLADRHRPQRSSIIPATGGASIL